MANGTDALSSVSTNGTEEKEVKQIAKVILWIKQHWFVVSLLAGYGWQAWQSIQTFKKEFSELKREVSYIKDHLDWQDAQMGLGPYKQKEKE